MDMLNAVKSVLADVSALTLRQSNIGDMGKERVYVVRGHADLRGNMSSGQMSWS